MFGRNRYFNMMLAAILLIAVCAQVAKSEETEKPATEKPAAALVNGKRIPMSDLDKEIQMAMMQNPALRSSEDITVLRQLRKKALNELIDRELILQAGQKANFQPQKIEIDTELAKIKQQFPSEDAFQQILTREKLTEEKLRNTITLALIRKKFLDIRIKPKSKPVTDEDIAAFYTENEKHFTQPEQLQASHVLLKVAPDASDEEKAEVKSKIQAILDEAKGGADFYELATEHSDCPSSARGGDLGFFARGQMVKPFDDAVFSLKKGQISEVVETRFGYHIITVMDRKPEKLPKLEEVSETIRGILQDKSVSNALEEWLKPAREEADIKILFKG